MRFKRNATTKDSDSGYSALGIKRLDAYHLLITHLNEVRTIIQPAVEECLLTRSFIGYLAEQNLASTGLLAAFKIYQQTAQQSSDLTTCIDNLNRYANDLVIVVAYLDYDLKNKKMGISWTHPLVLHALAHIQDFELNIWQLSPSQELIAHLYYPHYRPARIRKRIDLLSADDNHFEVLEPLQQNIQQQNIVDNGAIDQSLPDSESSVSAMALLALTKITSYLKQNTSQIDIFAPLLQSTPFRKLFKHELHKYWLANDDFLDNESLKKFDGHALAEELIENLRSQLKNNPSDKAREQLIEMVRFMKLLATLDRDVTQLSVNKTAKSYRAKAYLLIDWLAALAGIAPLKILANVYLQAAIYFQKAASVESPAHRQMADEKLALEFYHSAIFIAGRATPDVEYYVLAHSLKSMLHFNYAKPDLKEIILALQQRCLNLADIFPFHQTLQANAAFLVPENASIGLMRQFLHALVDMINAPDRARLLIDHDYTTVFYQVYEACLQNWYEEHYNPETENTFRSRLMEELLRAKNWNLSDITANLNDPWYRSGNSKGWTLPASCLHYANHNEVTSIKQIKGFEIDYENAELTFILENGHPLDPNYEKLLTFDDLNELFSKEIRDAIFSLDPADTEMKYHPFNQMNYSPSSLLQTKLLHTLLTTDYLLKFFTVGQEVQLEAPFNMRPIDHLVKDLPEYLKKIIEDFHAANRSPDIHRFWIEAEEIPVAITDSDSNDQACLAMGKESLRYSFGEMRMVVKKHKMVRNNVSGALEDTKNDDEGWSFYVLIPAQLQELKAGQRTIHGPAMIFIGSAVSYHWGSNKLYLLEEKTLSREFSLKNCDLQLRRLFRLERDNQEKVKRTSPAIDIIYRITHQVAEQLGISTRFSPEFIFAQEFTRHYDEFAQYFPEFGRLKELSRAIALVKIMYSQRKQNKEQIAQLEEKLTSREYWQEVALKIKPMA
jgi:hypothetical protein